MFVQVIQGRVSDAAAMRTAMDQWMRDLAPGATGWLGSTAGVTEDGRFIALARFDSEQDARRNSDRPEQGEWWAETAKLLDGEATFHDSTTVVEDLVGDPDDAGFVQVMQGRGSDPDRARDLMTEDSGAWRDFRPDIIGSLSLQHDADGWTMAIWFTSEEAAREGERKDPPAEMKAQMDELNSLMIGQPEFFDLKDPWLSGPKP